MRHDLLYSIAMRVNDSDPLSLFDIVDHEIEQKFGFSCARLAHHIDMPEPIFVVHSDRNGDRSIVRHSDDIDILRKFFCKDFVVLVYGIVI